MPVYVIGTLKPKNNGKFPVAEAVDIKVTDDLRLDEALGKKADLETIDFALNNKADKETTTSLQAQINELITPVTQDAEVQNARIDVDGTSYETLKARLDADFNKNQEAINSVQALQNEHEKKYYSNTTINLYDSEDPDCVEGYGFSGTTDTLVAQANLDITGYITVYNGVKITALMDNKAIFNNAYGFASAIKVAIYDSAKTWIKTVDLVNEPYLTADVDFGLNGYIRIVHFNDKTFSVTSEIDKLINGELVDFADGSIGLEKLSASFVSEYEHLKEVVFGARADYFEGVSFEMGQYLNNTTPFDSPSASTNTANTDTLLRLSDLATSITILDNNYKFAIVAFNSDGSFLAGPSDWITDKAVITKEDILANPSQHSFEYFTIQLRKKDSSDYDFTQLDLSTIFSADKQIVEEENYFTDVDFEMGQYTNASTPFGSPSASTNTANTNKLLKLSELQTSITVLSADYKFSIVAFNSDGSFLAAPSEWITGKSVITKEDILANPTVHSFEYFSIQIRKNDSADADFTNKEVTSVLSATKRVYEDQECDLIMFMGQSNMAGRGVTSQTWPETAPIIADNAGYEFRAISDPTKLYPIAEPFGVSENNVNGINDYSNKTGSMVTAFANEYYAYTKKTVVGVSASVGGTSSSAWLPTGSLLPDAIQRLASAVTYLNSNNIRIRHKFMVWCQGESDGDADVTKSTYITNFNTILNAMKTAGIEKCFLVRIGNRNIDTVDTKYSTIIEAQTEIAQTNKDVVMISTDFAGMKERGLMKDDFHYYQAGYNEVGRYAGVNAAFYANNGKEPTMYDTEFDNLYFSHKN